MTRNRKLVWTARTAVAAAAAMALLAVLYATGILYPREREDMTTRAAAPTDTSPPQPLPHTPDTGTIGGVPAMAVVDLEEIRKSYRKFSDREAAITRREKELNTQLEGLNARAESLSRKRDGFREKSTQWWEYDRALNNALAELESAAKKAGDEIKRLDLALMEEVVGDITAAIEKYCKEGGIKIVFWEKKVLLDRPSIIARTAQLELINVLYADSSLDITRRISEALNKSYSGE